MLDMGFQDSVEEILAASYTTGTRHQTVSSRIINGSEKGFNDLFFHFVCRKRRETSNVILLRNSPRLGRNNS